MNNDPLSHGLWERTAPAAPETVRLDQDIDCDAIVVGGGFTGVSAALHLAEAGVRVVLIEAAEIGFGGSGRNVGLVNAGLWNMPDAVEALLGPVHGTRLLELLGAAPALVFGVIERHGIACEAERQGTLHCAVGAAGVAEIEARAAQWRARGAPVRLLDAEATARAVGSDAYAGALLDERAGTIQPLAYVRGLAQAAIQAGARLFTRTAAVSAVRDGGRWRIATEGGAVRAKWAIVATNAYTTASAGLPWACIGSELVRLPYFQFATPPLSHNLRRSILPGRQGAWDTKEILSSFRLDAAGRLVFGSVGALRGSGLPVHRAWAKRAIGRIFPQLGPISFEASWYGRIGMTTDAAPRLHEFGSQMIGFSGYNGRGIGPGTAFGSVLAKVVLGQSSLEDLALPATPVQPARFRALKSAYYEFGSQAAHLAEERF